MVMLITPLGTIIVKVDGYTIDYNSIRLPCKRDSFNVDARYKINLTKSYMNKHVQCILVKNEYLQLSSCIESGEDLALISFYKKNIKLSIGVEYNYIKDSCRYLDNGIEIVSNDDTRKDVIFGVAWKDVLNKEVEDIFTWLAADPTLF